MSDAQTDKSSPVDTLLSGLKNTVRRVLDRNTIGIWAACSALAAFSGPFGTYKNESFSAALMIWAVLLGCAIGTAFLVHELCRVVFPRLSETHLEFCFLPIGSIAISLVIDSLLTFWLERPASVRPGLLDLWAYVIGIILLINLVRRMLPSFEDVMSEMGSAHVPGLPPASLPPQCRLAQRLDIPAGRRIIRISADGHFVEVQTCAQTHRIRMRFSDAIAELDHTVGVTVHRSHWVHRDAITGWVPNVAKPYVVLENSAEVPVSKTNFAKVDALGLDVLDAQDLRESEH